jgi:two-component system chemotaxis response regulator CheB
MIKVLVVDDSLFMRNQIKDLLQQDKDIEVIGEAKDGLEAIERVKELKPDVVTLDILMPKLDGLETLKQLMKTQPTKVVMVSGADKTEADIGIKSLEEGAIGFVSKPYGPISPLEMVKDEIIQQVKNASKVDLEKFLKRKTKEWKVISRIEEEVEAKVAVAIGASLGGIKAIEEIIPKIRYFDHAAFFVAQHLPYPFTSAFADRLNKLSSLKVVEAEANERIVAGRVYVAPGGYKLELKDKQIKLEQEVKPLGIKNTIDILMESIAKEFGANSVGIILTGMGSDGTKGLKRLRKKGAFTIAESRESCTVFGMPKSAIEVGAADEVLPVDQIADAIQYFLKEMDQEWKEKSI